MKRLAKNLFVLNWRNKLETNLQETIADMKGIPTRDELMKMLKEDHYTVSFLKLDGDRRVMTCTLHEDVVPPATKKDPLSQKKGISMPRVGEAFDTIV